MPPEIWTNRGSGQMEQKFNFDALMQEVCVDLGWCGGIVDGHPSHVTDYIPESGPVTADQANEDFDASVDPDSVEDRGSGIRTGTTPSGENITVRPSSAKGKGPATVEVTRGNGRTRETDKIRYPEPEPRQ